MIIYIMDRNGEVLEQLTYDTEEELLQEWPYAYKDKYGDWMAWVGGRR